MLAMPAPTDGGGTGQTAPPPDAAPEMCDAVSLATVADAGAAACFECVANRCMAQLTACSTDCACAPAFGCVEQMTTAGSLNTGYSACPSAVDAFMNGDPGLTMLNNCASKSCNAPCFGGANGGGDGGAGD
jgi:hypothetical protein